MTVTQDDYDAAIRAYWAGRDLQAQKQLDSGRVDAGLRGTATGGAHLNALQELVASQFSPLAKRGAIVRCSGHLPIPGFYRRMKNWDIVVTYRDVLVAAIECKSQNGPSFGNNFNNRTEEALGNSVDLWRSYETGNLGKIRPWLGFVHVMEHAQGSTSVVRDHGRPVFRPDSLFDNTSYMDRYGLLFQRLVSERLYDAACLISTKRGEGIHSEPVVEVSTANLTAAISARVTYIEGLINSRTI